MTARLIRWAKLLAWGSLAWMTAEGVIAVFAGFTAGRIACIGFGLDSAIEGRAYLSLRRSRGSARKHVGRRVVARSAGGLLIAYVAVREGREAWNGEER